MNLYQHVGIKGKFGDEVREPTDKERAYILTSRNHRNKKREEEKEEE